MTEGLMDFLRGEADRRTAHAPPPPSPERVRRAAGRQRGTRVVAAAAGVLLICAGTALVLRPVSHPHPAPGKAGPEQLARARASAIADGVVLPTGARPVASPPAPILKQPTTWPRTDYLVVATRFWTAPGTLSGVGGFFRQQRENGQAFNGTGTAGFPGRPVSIAYVYGELQVTLAPVDAKTVGIRIDAQVLWTPPKPASERVPGGVRSVEVFDYQGGPGHVRRVLTGAQAQHLADLVNALVRVNRGTHGCPQDTGQRTTLTFTTVHGTAVVDWFFCGSVVLTVDGRRQPGLRLSDDLARAVAAALGTAPSPSR